MLYYRRRHSTEPHPKREKSTTHILLTCCNWSYCEEKWIDTPTLIRILSDYHKEYTPFYLRIFNEVPNSVVSSFLSVNNIDPAVLKEVYDIMDARGVDLKDFEEYTII